MYGVIYGAADFHQLQEGIDKLVAWAQKWQLRLNVSKCYLLHLGKPHQYNNIQGNLISPSDSV